MGTGQNTQPLSCGLPLCAWWDPGGGGEGQNLLSLCALHPDAPRSSRSLCSNTHF